MNGPALRDAREQKGFTAKAFCAYAKVSRQYLDDVEKGRRQPRRMWVYNVADKLGVQFTEFCDPIDEDVEETAGAA